MLSRSTTWRRRRRARDYLNAITPCNVVLANSMDNQSSHFFYRETVISNPTQSDSHDNDKGIFDEQPTYFSTSFKDDIAFVGIDEEKHVFDDVAIDSEAQDENEVEDSEFFNLSAEPSIHEVAAVLSILKIRHKLSNRCLDHFCRLMRLLKTRNVPKSSAHIKRILLSESKVDFIRPSYFCSKCNRMSTNETNCSNVNCSEYKGFSEKPPVFVLMPLKPQIQNVLSRFPSNYFRQKSNSTSANSSNISEGVVYKKVLENEGEDFISLVMNVDGIEISKSSHSSLWILTFIINELSKPERFQIQNVLVGGIGAGLSKPTRNEMAAYLQPIVSELLSLENECCYKTSDGTHLFLKVFLIAGSMDKPAQALVQNLTEVNGAFGCGKCLIKGITVPTKPESTKKVRVFPIRKNDDHPKLRNNFTYDVKMAIPESFRPKKKNALRDYMYGYMGECHLRDLRYFDVGRSFAFDTLHNLYRGTFSRLLDLWFDAQHRHQPWSLQSRIELINISLCTHKFPSTTYRIPRSILKYYQFKANELRCVLLFGFSSFCMYLPKKYCRHFLLLVIAAHLCESKAITSEQLSQIKILTSQFIYQFPLLYGDRQNVMSVHSIIHLPESIRDFGGVYNYSTFNFESYLG
ncbi:unnamed protein product [Rotaria sp. Silwood1]|nr:unnamed protein product [Rotaria sp. Silwood1]